MVIYLLLFFIMFRTVFCAVLAALVVYKIIDHLDIPALSEKAISTIIVVIGWWLKIFFVWALIWRLYSWVSDNRWEVSNLLEAIRVILLVALIFGAILFVIITINSYLKFRFRKKYWLLKKTAKFSLFSDDTKLVNSLSKKDKELDEEISKKVSRCWMRALLAFPILIIIGSLVLFGMMLIETYL